MTKHNPRSNGHENGNENGSAEIEEAIPVKAGFLVVGIGASAGGVQALREFFTNVPPDSGIAYVVILHLSPDFDSQLTEVLQQTTSMPVLQVTGRARVEPNHIYVVPPDMHLSMSENYVEASKNVETADRRAPVDIFFRSLAESHGPRSVAVVLSGTGANGSMGLKRVKELGGVVFVQNPREAEFNDMPRNAIATDLVDEVLPVAKIPEKIVAYRDGLGTVEIPDNSLNRAEDQQRALREIFTQLRIRTGHDFSNYKRPTLLRRLERRINVRGLSDLPAYADAIREDPDESQALLKDLLISVTNFFRDKDAFEFLEKEVLPKIFAKKNLGDQVRIWCVGCATGEEAYSLAMLCAEQTMGMIEGPKIQIFATDIDEAAIATGREGLYSLNDAADVSPERLRRFFTKEGDEYRIRRELREMVLFANHNVIKDPPFSHIDLATCRNLLIYMNNTAKERVMETLHFALEPGGFLFLGSSESVDGAGDLYATYNREHHIFQSRQAGIRPYPVPESVPTFRLEPAPERTPRSQEKRALERISFGELHQQLLEQYAPPSLVVNEDHDIVHLSERAGKYLRVAGGDPSNNLLKLVLPELRLELRTALHQAVQRRTGVNAPNLKVPTGTGTETITIHVRPVLSPEDTARGFFLVIFEPVTEETAPAAEPVSITDEPIARQLEEELVRTKLQLRMSSEQYEIQAEELKASNEELQAINEELRSAAEELETSKEELQSINEELRTVNQELKVKVEETTISSNNLQNLINSTDIGTIFLDRSLRVQLFTPSSREIFNLIQADHGRPLSDITHRLNYTALVKDAESVMETLHTIEREVSTAEDKDFMMRILPYRTTEDRISGVVVTFFDITERKRAERELLERTDELTRFNQAMVGREQRMIELKKEINDLCGRLNEPPRFNTDLDDEGHSG
jgi:two-component system CheB/CheR fusion protein